MNGSGEKNTIRGRIENIVYRNESNDYTVLEISTEDNDLLTAVGVIPLSFEGEDVVLRGAWIFHKEFGKQFAFDSFEKTLPKEIDGILQYLSSKTVKGIGPVTALKIVNKYGTDTFDVIENHPEWLADIPGITLKKAAIISESFREQSGIRGVMMFCKDYMNPQEVTRVYKRFGAGAIGILQDNPYILFDGEFGIPFDKADAMALSLGHPKDSARRIESGLKYILYYNAATNGHTCLPKNKLTEAVAKLLELESERVEAELSLLLKEGSLCCYNKEQELYIMSKEVEEDENYIAERLHALPREAVSYSHADISSLVEIVETELNIKFAPLQKQALFLALGSGVMVLTGGPGTGKTTVIKALIRIFDNIGIKSVLSAPTGRAAKRMSEATGAEAKTVHRLLEMDRGLDGSTKFCRNQNNPLSEGVVIVDEASMLDLSLTAALFRALKRGARLIIIGDSDQLPSVGAGNVLSDIIKSERINTVCLTEIFRQSGESLIITNAHKINKGEPPTLNITDNDFFFVNRENETEIANTVADLISKRLPKTYGEQIRDKIQVITPSRKGLGGVETLNRTLQQSLNPPAKFKKERSRGGVIFRVGDKVMQLTNNYDIEWTKRGIEGVGLFNGDIGVIEDVDLKEEELIINFDERIVRYSFEMLEELELAYAITVHKSQGSEYPVVIIPAYNCPPILMTRNLLYTAVTRAKNMVILVGRAEVPRKMVGNNREILRYTTLRDKICDYI